MSKTVTFYRNNNKKIVKHVFHSSMNIRRQYPCTLFNLYSDNISLRIDIKKSLLKSLKQSLQTADSLEEILEIKCAIQEYEEDIILTERKRSSLII